MKPGILLLALAATLGAIFAGILLTGCETTGVTVNGPGWVLSYDKATGVAVHVSAK